MLMLNKKDYRIMRIGFAGQDRHDKKFIIYLAHHAGKADPHYPVIPSWA